MVESLGQMLSSFWTWLGSSAPSGSMGLLLGALAILLALRLYHKMYRLLPDRGSFFHEIPRLISHVPHSAISASHHIRAGVLLVAGMSLIVGIGFAQLFSFDASMRSYSATNAGFALGVVSVALVLWTLHQTKKIERLQGEPIRRFDSLVKIMTDEIDKLVELWDANRDKSAAVFRVYIVTNNPYFGVNSFPGKKVALDYDGAVKRLVGRFRECKRTGQTGGYRLRIMCADPDKLGEFNSHYSDRDGYDAKTRNELSEGFISAVAADLGADAIIRIPVTVAEVQFVIIGDTVFEFILEPPTDAAARVRGSNIQHTTRIEDRVVAERFERYVYFLESLILARPAAVSGGAPPGGSTARR